jgi:NADH-quinone oxidoreductase subunit L
MTVPLIVLAVCSVCVAWGWPIWNAEASAMEHHISHTIGQENSPYQSIIADYGRGGVGDELWYGRPLESYDYQGIRAEAHHAHPMAGVLALFSAGLGFLFAYIVYLRRTMDPADAVAQFPGVYAFLGNKWAFDDLYSAILVRPALVVSGWFRWFDTKVIDGVVDGTGRFIVRVAKWDGKFDNGIIDGIANLLADIAYGIGGWFRRWQTGYLRSYILFLVLAAVGLFALLRYLVGMAAAGP